MHYKMLTLRCALRGRGVSSWCITCNQCIFGAHFQDNHYSGTMTKEHLFLLMLLLTIMLVVTVLWNQRRVMPEKYAKTLSSLNWNNANVNFTITDKLSPQNRGLEEAKDKRVNSTQLHASFNGQQSRTREDNNENHARKYEEEEMFSKSTKMNMPKIGEWKSGLRYQKTCVTKKVTTFACCGDNERKLHFRFFNESLNNEDVAKTFLSKVKGKNMTILGDSLQRGLFWGMMEFLQLGKFLDKLLRKIFGFLDETSIFTSPKYMHDFVSKKLFLQETKPFQKKSEMLHI